MQEKKIVRKMEDISNAVGEMRDAMERTPAREQEKQCKLTEFKKKFPDALYLEPKERRPTGAKHNPDYREVLARYEERHGKLEYLLEYVVGICESQLVGGALEFDLGEIPGEDYCRWKIPVNKPVGIPRFVAKHIEKNLAWKEMKPLGRDNPPGAFYEDEMMEPFGKFEYKKRATFHPINAY